MRSHRSTPGGGPVATLKTEWRVLSGFGRAALIGVAVSMIIAIILGFIIPSFVRKELIDSRVATFSSVAQDLAARGLIPSGTQGDGVLGALDDAVRFRLLGGDVVRVKLWNEEGTVLYSDAPELIGNTYPPTPERLAAFAGEVTVQTPDVARPENEFERGGEPLMEFYVPVRAGGDTIGVFEVYERSSPLQATIASTRRTVWLSIGIALTLLGGLVVALVASTARLLTRRARIAEGLVVELSRAQEEERHRIVGALHDDIGQPLYRVLYGIQGCRSQMDEETPISEELERLEGLLETVDGTLRTELRLLDHGSPENVDLNTLLTELADSTARETGLEVTLDVEDHEELPVAHRAALFRAAREAIINARKHARASSLSIRVRDGNRRLLLDVEDDGVGVSYPPGLGLTTTRQRLEAIGGGLTVIDREGPGTLLRAWVPHPQPTGRR